MAPVTFSSPLCLSMMQTTEALSIWNVVRLSLKHLLDPMASDLLGVDLTLLHSSNAHGLKSWCRTGTTEASLCPLHSYMEHLLPFPYNFDPKVPSLFLAIAQPQHLQ